MMDKNIEAFLALVRAGLWEKDVRLSPYNPIDFKDVYRLAREQAVIGLVAAGLEHVTDIKVPQEIVLTFVGEALRLEQRNTAMNDFISVIVEKMRASDIYTTLVKGQGVAQCYERPLWRASGDIDFYLSNSNFNKAKLFFRPLVKKFDPDNDYTTHVNMHCDPWIIEIHADQHSGLSFKIDRVLDEIHNSIFSFGEVKAWDINNTTVYIPSPDNHILIVFTHFLKHFYCGGLGLRQICDWNRIIWRNHKEINIHLLESRLKKMGLMTEWKAFASFAVNELGMSEEMMPLYNYDYKWKRKAQKICRFVIDVGNMGHNRTTRYYSNSRFIKKSISLKRRMSDIIKHSTIFPMDSFRFLYGIVYNGIRSAVRGE